MGWASGGELASKIEAALGPYLHLMPPDVVAKLGDEIADAFLDMDCDVLDECDGFIGDAYNRTRHPNAPASPKVGQRYHGKWGDAVWSGRRWEYE